MTVTGQLAASSKKVLKNWNHNKSGHIDNCSYVIGESVNFVSKLLYRTSSTILQFKLQVSVT